MNAIATRDPIARPIAREQLERLVPSLFASEAHESRSARYTYVPTIRIIDGLEKEGFLITSAKQSRTRDDSRYGFTKHMIRMRHAGRSDIAVGDVFPEVVIVNSHDGTSSYQISAGMFRLACTNGMVVNVGKMDEVRVGHTGDIASKVIEGSYRVLGRAVDSLEAPREWSHIRLSDPEKQIMAEAAHVLRFADANGDVATPVQPRQLLGIRRIADNAPDLWTTFNVIQENVIRGGLRAVQVDPETRQRRRVTTREVGGIDQDVKLNKALWTLTEKMAELKGFKLAA